MATGSTLLTVEDLLAFPDDGVKRWLIRGELRENREAAVTKRSKIHSSTMARLAKYLGNWSDQQPKPRGEVYVGEIGCWMEHDPDSAAGIDVVYLNGEQVAAQHDDESLIDGPLTLAAEILSPSNTIEEVEEKVQIYRKKGIRLVWVINPFSKTVTAYRPQGTPEFFHEENELTAPDVLPGFKVPVADLFA